MIFPIFPSQKSKGFVSLAVFLNLCRLRKGKPIKINGIDKPTTNIITTGLRYFLQPAAKIFSKYTEPKAINTG